MQGSDPGVSFLSEVNRDEGTVTVLASNYADNVWEAMRRIRRHLYAQADGKGGMCMRIGEEAKAQLDIRLDRAQPQDREALFRLLQYSLFEESESDGNEMNADALYDYPWFDAYFTDADRFAYLVREERTDRLLGYAMVRCLGGECYSIAEFMVIPKVRRMGVGRKTAFACFDRFRGSWEVRPSLGSERAYRFWRRVIDAYTGGNSRWEDDHFVFSNAARE